MIAKPISGCVITFNEERSIVACIKSMRAICDEIVVVDAHSTDRTRELALACGARVIERDWGGYRTQKQFAANAARNEWILSLDADEQVSPELAAEILRVNLHGLDVRAAYRMPFLARYYGHPMMHGDWHPDYHIRLFNRRRTVFGGNEVHERVISHGPVGRLRGHVLHDSYRDLDHQLGKLGKYATLMAEAMKANGRRAGALRLVLNPLWRFVRAYVLRRGYLDGWRGFAIAQIEANYVWEKYLRLYVSERASRTARVPAGPPD
jgi:glycosyltransferase involved in cell wall biosynthesis